MKLRTLACALLLLACSGPGNTGRRELPPELVAAVPWTNGAIPQRNGEFLVVPIDPVYPAISANRPDPGSRPVDCSPLDDIELSPYWVERFEPDPALSGNVGLATAWSSYDDETKGAFRVPGDASWYPNLVSPGKIYSAASSPPPPALPPLDVWGLAADRITNGPSCDGQPNEWALHFRGGRFNFFGAGAEHPLAVPFVTSQTSESFNACPQGSDFCAAPYVPGAPRDPVGLPPPRPEPGAPQRTPAFYLDLSRYDGITFWARRGPDSQPGILIALQDKHTSDALNRGNQTFCTRIKPCRVECQNGSRCEQIMDPHEGRPLYRCVDASLGLPNVERPPRAGGGNLGAMEPALKEELYPVCGPNACFSPSYYRDPDFHGDPELNDIECKIYEFSGSEARHYCYGSTPPPRDEERCGDAWTAPIHLSTDWQLYAIPFSEFRQVGFGKRAPLFDLHSVHMLALLFPVGWADVYIDNVSFYRRRR